MAESQAQPARELAWVKDEARDTADEPTERTFEPEITTEERLVFPDGEVRTREDLEADAQGGDAHELRETQEINEQVEAEEAAKREKGEQAADAETESGEADGEDGEDAEKPSPSAQRRQRRQRREERRYNEALKRAEAAEARAQAVEERIARLEQGNGAPEGDSTQATGAGDANAAPDMDDYEDPADYIKAQVAWELAQREQAADTPETPTDGGQEPGLPQHLVDAWQEIRQDGNERWGDFEQVVTAEDLAVTPTMLAELADSERAHEVLYHLGRHPDQAREIAELGENERGVARAIARLEATLPPEQVETEDEAPDRPPPSAAPPARRRTSQAPEPIAPISSGASGGQPRDPERESQDEYNARRRAERGRQGIF